MNGVSRSISWVGDSAFGRPPTSCRNRITPRMGWRVVIQSQSLPSHGEAKIVGKEAIAAGFDSDCEVEGVG